MRKAALFALGCFLAMASSPAISETTLNITAAVSAPSGVYSNSPNAQIYIHGASTHTYQITGGVANTSYSFGLSWGLSWTPGNGSWGGGGSYPNILTDGNGTSLTYTNSVSSDQSFTVHDGTTDYTATAATTVTYLGWGITAIDPGATTTATSSFSTYGEG